MAKKPTAPSRLVTAAEIADARDLVNAPRKPKPVHGDQPHPNALAHPGASEVRGDG